MVRYSTWKLKDQVRANAEGWWLFRGMSVAGRGERVELQRGETLHAQEAWQAYWSVQQTMDDGGDDAIRLVLALLDAAPDDESMVLVAAGPLEDLINEHGDDLVELIEKTARQSSMFAGALESVWVDRVALRPETFDRLAPWLRTS